MARADDEQPLPDALTLTDVIWVVETCVERFGALAAAHGVDLSFEQVGSGQLTVQAQPDLIDRLAGVLIDNACKFAGDGGCVQVSVARNKDLGCASVSMTLGPGIPESRARSRV